MPAQQSGRSLRWVRIAPRLADNPASAGFSTMMLNLFGPACVFEPLFRRYGIVPGDESASLCALIEAMARKHEPGFKPKRGRRKAAGMTAAQDRDWWLFAYIEHLRQAKRKPALWVITHVVMRRPAFRDAKLTTLSRGYLRMKKTSPEGDYERVIRAGELVAASPEILDTLQQRTWPQIANRG